MAEVKKKELVHNIITSDSVLSRLMAVRPWQKCVKIVARLCRKVKKQLHCEHIDIDEMTLAELVLVTWSQSESFTEGCVLLLENKALSTKHKLSRLGVYLDTKSMPGLSLLRLSGRTQLAKLLRFEARCPLPLAMSSPFVGCLIEHYHINVLLHCRGINTLLSMLQKKFWLLDLIASLRRYLQNCVV